ncbi:hypothetical protein Y882_06800 [Dyella japonica DSM 16301]|uniref:Uncharacterized protein n=1 Tax=Dyella japonica DSM 16301 TaxID=1440762 RepID=A0A0G9H4Z4_9GAMM|nr:hypothetical protein Y882_06800 [Dyella japonica DSM 16301]
MRHHAWRKATGIMPAKIAMPAMLNEPRLSGPALCEEERAQPFRSAVAGPTMHEMHQAEPIGRGHQPGFLLELPCSGDGQWIAAMMQTGRQV